MTPAELQGWEDGIRTAKSPDHREWLSALLREEILARGVEGVGREMVEVLLLEYV
jgi:hypothetical protein